MVTTANMKLAYECEDNAANTTVNDEHSTLDGTASANTSTLTAVAKDANGFELAGSGWIDSGQTQADAAFSISVWFTWDGVDTFTVLFGNGGSGQAGAFYVQLRNDNGDKPALFVRDSGGATINNSTYSESVAVGDDAFHHLVLTFDGADAWKMYVDGNLMTLADSTGTYTNLGNTVDFGYESISDPTKFDGKLDAIYWWDRELSAQDVTDLYNSGSGLFYPFATSVTLTPSALALTLSQGADVRIVQQAPVSFSSTVSQPVHNYLTVGPAGTISVGTGKIGTRFLSKRWPITEGLTAGTTKLHGRKYYLTPSKQSLVPQRIKIKNK